MIRSHTNTLLPQFNPSQFHSERMKASANLPLVGAIEHRDLHEEDVAVLNHHINHAGNFEAFENPKRLEEPQDAISQESSSYCSEFQRRDSNGVDRMDFGAYK